MANIDDLISKYKKKLNQEQETEEYKNEKVEPLALKFFTEDFSSIFKNISEKLNKSIGTNLITFKFEGKNKFYIQGQYHRIYFQKSHLAINQNIISVNIIPIYLWKGITKHLGPITIFINTNNENVKWDIPFETPEEYSKYVFGKLIEDEDFTI